MKTAQTFRATIYIGFKHIPTGEEKSIQEAYEICQKYCDAVGLCVTVTPTRFVYTGGSENGAAIGLINYPRFPATDEKIKDNAIDLAYMLKGHFCQQRVSIVFDDNTVMLGDAE